MKKDIIILSNSYKHDGRCIAGIDAETGKWIRLYSSNLAAEGAVPLNQLIYENGSIVSLYDVVKVDLTTACPTLVQPENWHYDENESWKLVRKSNLDEVRNLHGYDRPSTIFQNTDTKLLGDTVFHSGPSLLLLKLYSSEVFIKTFDGTPRIQLCFTYNGDQYKYFKITDIEVCERFRGFSDGFYPLNPIVSAIFSLTDKYARSGKYYKVVARILD